MDRIAHPFKIRLAEQFGHGRCRNSCRLWHKDGVLTFLVPAGVVNVVLSIVMHIHCFSANGAFWMLFCPRRKKLILRGVWCPLKLTPLALILLMSMRIFSIAIKVRFVVALRAANLIQFCHEDSSPFWEYMCFVVKPLYQKG